MTVTQLSAIVGVLFSLAFTFIPGLKDLYAGLEATKKSLVMALVLLVVTAAVFGLSCLPTSPYQYFTCDMQGFWAAVEIFVAALIANQSTYILTRPFKPSAKKSG